MNDAGGIRYVSLDGGDLGLPATGYQIDAARATDSLTLVDRWARQMLKMLPSCPADHFVVCPVGIVGSGQVLMLREIEENLPEGVHVEGGQLYGALMPGGNVSPTSMFYLTTQPKAVSR
jgi:hypothetical protein